MKRDWELIRNILIKVEESDAGVDITDKDFPDTDVHTFSYHGSMLVNEAGFVQGSVQDVMRGAKLVFLKELTWDGHEFLDSIRDDSTWNSVKSTAKEKGANLSFEVIKGLGIQLGKSLAGLS